MPYLKLVLENLHFATHGIKYYYLVYEVVLYGFWNNIKGSVEIWVQFFLGVKILAKLFVLKLGQKHSLICLNKSHFELH